MAHPGDLGDGSWYTVGPDHETPTLRKKLPTQGGGLLKKFSQGPRYVYLPRDNPWKKFLHNLLTQGRSLATRGGSSYKRDPTRSPRTPPHSCTTRNRGRDPWKKVSQGLPYAYLPGEGLLSKFSPHPPTLGGGAISSTCHILSDSCTPHARTGPLREGEISRATVGGGA